MNVTTFNGLNALLALLMVIVGSVIVLAQARKISREQLVQTAEDWQSIATARTGRVDELQSQVNTLQASIVEMNGKLGSIAKENQWLVRRNLMLEKSAEGLRQMIRDICKQTGITVPIFEEVDA